MSIYFILHYIHILSLLNFFCNTVSTAIVVLRVNAFNFAYYFLPVEASSHPKNCSSVGGDKTFNLKVAKIFFQGETAKDTKRS